jgi:hypothetical protein
MTTTRTVLSLALAGLLGALSQAAAQTPLGQQLRVDPSNLDPEPRYAPSLAFNPAGTLWIAWESHDSALNGVAVRSVSPSGALSRMILALPGTGQVPLLVPAPGGFALFAEDERRLIEMRRFNDLGALRGPLVLAQKTADPTLPYAVAPLPHGGFFLTWTTDDCPGIRCTSSGVSARGLDGLGRALTPPFRVTPSIVHDQVPTGVVADPAGNVFVIWGETVPQDPLLYVLFARRFSRAGQPLSGPIRVSEQTSGLGGGAAADAAGNFVVTWQSVAADGEQSIHARRYSSQGTPLGPELLVSGEASSAATFPQVAMSAAGDFFVVWESFGCAECDYVDVKGRLFRADGTVEDEIVVNDYKVGSQVAPAAAFGPDGRLAVAWLSEAASHSDFEVDVKLYSVGAAGPP